MSKRITRRAAIGTTLAASFAGTHMSKAAGKFAWDSIVIGAGVFGTWTAWHLRKSGQRVLLLDAFGAAHARASSGGESRLTRGSYGQDEIYTRMAFDSLAQWKWLSDLSGLPILHQIGVLFFFQKREAYVDQSLEVHGRLKLPTLELDRAALEQRYPQVFWKDVEVGLLEPGFGVLMARRAVQSLLRQFVKAGGEYRDRQRQAPDASKPLAAIELADGSSISAANYVFACGPWLPRMFARLLGPRIFPTRQEVFFFATPPGDARFTGGALPGWADFNSGDIFYGMPDLEVARFQGRSRQAWPGHRSGSRRPRGLTGRAGRCARLSRATLSRAGQCTAQRGARLPVREQLEWRPAHRSASDRVQRVVGRRGLGPWFQAWSRGGPLCRGAADGQAQESRIALQPGNQGGTAESRRSLN